VSGCLDYTRRYRSERNSWRLMLLGYEDLHLLYSNPHWHLVEMTLIKAGTQYVLCCGVESADERLALTEMAPGIL
ncbi:hypothetical protein, partial [Agrobacterium tumefaciens]|uniref:hypothetical protein n=1 Tax=Agrobacterium tumefaciens TaxID=358 RepID=UPI001BAA07C0